MPILAMGIQPRKAQADQKQSDHQSAGQSVLPTHFHTVNSQTLQDTPPSVEAPSLLEGNGVASLNTCSRRRMARDVLKTHQTNFNANCIPRGSVATLVI